MRECECECVEICCFARDEYIKMHLRVEEYEGDQLCAGVKALQVPGHMRIAEEQDTSVKMHR